MTMRRVLLYTHDDQPLGELAPADVFALLRTEQLDRAGSLDIGTCRVLSKGWRVLLQDGMGAWHEYVVEGVDASHQTGTSPIGSYHCTDSMQHDLSLTAVSVMPGVQGPVTAGAALEAALSTTRRWVPGDVTQTTTAGASMYQRSAWEALGVLSKTWGGEVHAQIDVDDHGVVGRRVGLAAQRGSAEATRRFDYGEDVSGISRKVDEEPTCCRIIPRGKGIETESGGRERKITIESVNGGRNYLENAATALLVRLPDGNGGWEYPVRYVDYPEIEEPAALKAAAQADLAGLTAPKVTYEASVVQLAQAGMDAKGVAVGDLVHVVDRKFGDQGLRVEGRITKLVTNELDANDVKVTIGHVSEALGSALARRFTSLNASLARMSAIQTSLSTDTQATKTYLDNIVANLNAEINANGGYTYITEGQGIRTYDRAVTDPLVGAEASSVVEVKGGSIRIANSRTSAGEWDWRTVFVSGHIAADLVTAANITTGYIGSPTGNYWNLDTGEMRMAATSTIGDRQVSELISDIDATITGVDVQYAESQSQTVAPTSGWQSAAPVWREGWYIWQRTATTSAGGTEYSQPTCISGREGADGQGVTVSAIEYGVSASDRTAPTSWSQTAPSEMAKGSWLWVRTTYSNGTTSMTKSYVGQDGTDGQDGTSVTILGSYDTLEDLQRAHPTGSAGDGYIVAGDLYVWTGSAWEDVGTIQGPKGDPGADGAPITVRSVLYGTSGNASTEPTSWSQTAPTSVAKGSWLWIKTTFSDGTVAVNKSYSGVDGTAATVYEVTASVTAIEKTGEATLKPPQLTFKSTSRTGTGSSQTYAGRFVVKTSLDGTSWTTRYTSSANESSKTYAVPYSASNQTRFVECTLYKAGGTTEALDRVTVPVIAEGAAGADGADGADAYTVVLSNESHTFAGDTSKAVAASTNCNVIAYKGATRIAATIGTITGQPAGMTTAVYSNGTTAARFAVNVTTAMTKRFGELAVPVTVDGKTFNCVFSYALALVGETGEAGEAGVGVSAVVEQYYLSTSSTSQTGGSWSTAQPEWQAGRYIWTRSQVTWTDGQTTTTTPVLAKAVNAANQTAATANQTATNAKTAADAAKASADSANSTLAVLNTQQGIFNKLTNNGQTQGIFMQNGKLYLNGEYMKSGTISADLTLAGHLEADDAEIYGTVKAGKKSWVQLEPGGTLVFGANSSTSVSRFRGTGGSMWAMSPAFVLLGISKDQQSMQTGSPYISFTNNSQLRLEGPKGLSWMTFDQYGSIKVKCANKAFYFS